MSPENPNDKLDRIVSEARAASDQREQGYRSRALKMYPWVCGRCAREFDAKNLWELLCVYCHDNEHSRYTDAGFGDLGSEKQKVDATHNPFADLAAMLDKKK